MSETAPAKPERTEEELARIMIEAREARTTILVVAAFALGSMIFMFLIMIVVIALRYL